MKYAVGEIILVVIGILIALQINNLNQERILNEQNLIIVQNLNKEFSENLIELDSRITKFNRIIEGLEELLTVMRTQDSSLTEASFDELLQKTFWTPNWTPSSFVLVELKSSGALSKLKNNELKTLLFKWEREFANMHVNKDAYILYGEEYIEFITKNGSVRNIDALTEETKHLQKSTIANNSLELLKIPEFENRADNFYFLAFRLRDNFQALRVTMQDIVTASNAELNL
ncbi:hypothetical protein G5B37_05245 [Rasiella rasia]|uniref:Uncharacterized protein n=1 Tax=Rasiella rasia TaxID=2744027 RepID=A0A6G6GHW2_9FLAO|nr:DUF6090 family protein [Rasiella rasia]QIE58003.1 hypothetical protein G5B37_05245 [Rasiella rasia]